MLDIIDPIPVVYFQLNPADSIFYLTLTRTFNGEASALEMARDPNIVFYDSVDIFLEGWKDEYKIWETRFTLSERTKEPGIFPEVPGYCYNAINDNLRIWESTNSYRLIIMGPGLHKPAFSRIPRMPEVVVPQRYYHEIALYPNGYQFKSPGCPNAPYCQLLCKLYYEEYDGAWIKRTVTFQLKKNTLDSDKVIYPDLFFNQLVKSITPYKEGMSRRFISIDLVFLFGDQFYKDYVETYEYSGSQDLPVQGNINNGLGLFTMTRSAEYVDMYLNQQTLDSLSQGYRTRKLRFVKW